MSDETKNKILEEFLKIYAESIVSELEQLSTQGNEDETTKGRKIGLYSALLSLKESLVPYDSIEDNILINIDPDKYLN